MVKISSKVVQEHNKPIGEWCKGLKSRSGKTEYIKYLNGEYLTASERVKAACYYCCGGYQDGVFDCHNVECPLYPKRPYQGKELENTKE